MLSYDVRFLGEYASWLQIQDETREMSGSYEVVDFVVSIHGVLVGQELMRCVHAAERHVAAQFGDSHYVLAASSDKAFPL